MNASPNLTFKQQRFVEEYQVDGNGTQAVLRAGYNTKHPAEMAYGLLRNTKVKHSLQDAQRARRERLKMRVDSTVKQYIELREKALEACDYQTSLRALNQLVKHLKIFEHYHAAPLLDAIEKNPEELEELVDQFLWINTSLCNWSCVLRATNQKAQIFDLILHKKKISLKMTRFWMDSHLGELEMWIHRFIGKPSQIKEFEDTGT